MRIKKIICTVLSAIIISSSLCSIPAYAAWETDDSGTKYIEYDGNYCTGWKKIDGKTYYFNSKGIMKTGWIKTSSGKYYYFKKDGSMVTGVVKINGKKYVFNNKGVLENSTNSEEQTKSANTNIDREALKKEFYELKELKYKSYDTMQEVISKYDEAKKGKEKALAQVKELEKFAKYYKDKGDYYGYKRNMIKAERAQDLADDFAELMKKFDKSRKELLEIYNRCKERMAEIKKILER